MVALLIRARGLPSSLTLVLDYLTKDYRHDSLTLESPAHLGHKDAVMVALLGSSGSPSSLA